RQARLEERDGAGLQRVDLGLVDVQPDHVIAEFDHAHRVGGAEVAGADHREARALRHQGVSFGTALASPGPPTRLARWPGWPGSPPPPAWVGRDDPRRSLRGDYRWVTLGGWRSTRTSRPIGW